MDFENTLDSNISSGLELSGESKNYLKEASKWVKFISIVYFVFIGLMGIMMIFAGSVMAYFLPNSEELGMAGGAAMTGVMVVYFLIIGALMFFPALFLYRFATKTQEALESENTAALAEGLKNMKSYWKFVGIITLIFVSLYGIMFLFMIVGGGMAAMMG